MIDHDSTFAVCMYLFAYAIIYQVWITHVGSSNLVTHESNSDPAARINTVAFGHSADSALDFRCHLKQLADVGRVLSHVRNDFSVFACYPC